MSSLIKNHAAVSAEITEADLEEIRAAIDADNRKRETATLAQGFADCEALISEGLRKLAEAEDIKAGEAQELGRVAKGAGGMIEYQNEHLRRSARAACLREAALAVSLGQFRDVPRGE
jgi:hypothetical protein